MVSQIVIVDPLNATFIFSAIIISVATNGAALAKVRKFSSVEEDLGLAIVSAAPRRVTVSIARLLELRRAETRVGGLGDSVVVPHVEVLESGAVEGGLGEETSGLSFFGPVEGQVS